MADIKIFQEKLMTDGVNFKGFGLVYKFVMEDATLSMEAKGIYAYLCSFAGNKDSAFPKRNTILHDLGLSQNGYYSHYNQLIANGYIAIQKSKGLFSRNTYVLVSCPDKFRTATNYSCLKDFGYGIIPKAVMSDERLDIKAKGLYAYLACYCPSYDSAELRKSVILYHLNISEKTYYTYYNQLLNLNYITKHQKRTENKFGVNDYQIVRTPNTESVLKQPVQISKNECTSSESVKIESGKNECVTNITISNKTSHNKTQLSSSEQAKLAKMIEIEAEIIQLKNKLNYEYCIIGMNNQNIENIDNSIRFMAEILTNKADNIMIGKSFFGKEAFRHSISNLKLADITNIWDRIRKLENPIVNIRNYVISSLYNQGLSSKAVQNEPERSNSSFDIDKFFALAVARSMGR